MGNCFEKCNINLAQLGDVTIDNGKNKSNSIGSCNSLKLK